MNGINIVLKAVPSKTTMPILECILIDAVSDEIKLTGNDMELGIETKVEGTILERGKIALDAKLFSDIIRKLSGENSTITIESDEKYNTTIIHGHDKIAADMEKNESLRNTVEILMKKISPQ